MEMAPMLATLATNIIDLTQLYREPKMTRYLRLLDKLWFVPGFIRSIFRIPAVTGTGIIAFLSSVVKFLSGKEDIRNIIFSADALNDFTSTINK